MADIQDWLNEIVTEDYGENVRWPIHDSIDALNKYIADVDSKRSSGMAAFENRVNDTIGNLTTIIQNTQIGDEITAAMLSNAISSVSISVLAFDDPVGGHRVIGDGITDCSVGIQNAVIAAATNKQALFFPAGTYYCKTPIHLMQSIQIGEDEYEWRSPLGVYGVGDDSVLDLTFDSGGWMIYEKENVYLNNEYERYYNTLKTDDRTQVERRVYTTDKYVLRNVPMKDGEGNITYSDFYPAPRPVTPKVWYNSIREFLEDTDVREDAYYGVLFNGGTAPYYDFENNVNRYDRYTMTDYDIPRCQRILMCNFKMIHSGLEHDSPDCIRGTFVQSAFYNVGIWGGFDDNSDMRIGICMNFGCYVGRELQNGKYVINNSHQSYLNSFYNIKLHMGRCGIFGSPQFNANNFYYLEIQNIDYGMFLPSTSRNLLIEGGDIEQIRKRCFVVSSVANLTIDGVYAEAFPQFVNLALVDSYGIGTTINIKNCYLYALGNTFPADKNGWLAYIAHSKRGRGRYRQYTIRSDGTISATQESYNAPYDVITDNTHPVRIFSSTTAWSNYWESLSDAQKISYVSAYDKIYIDGDSSYPSTPSRILVSDCYITADAYNGDAKLIKAPNSWNGASHFVDLRNNYYYIKGYGTDKILTYYDIVGTDPVTIVNPATGVETEQATDPDYLRFGSHPLRCDIPLYMFETRGEGTNNDQRKNIYYNGELNTKYLDKVHRLLVTPATNTNDITGNGCLLNFDGTIAFGPYGWRRTISKETDYLNENGQARRITVHLENGELKMDMWDEETEGCWADPAGLTYIYRTFSDFRVAYATWDDDHPVKDALINGESHSYDNVYLYALYNTNIDGNGYPHGSANPVIPLPSAIVPRGFAKRGYCAVRYASTSGGAVSDVPSLVPCRIFSAGSGTAQNDLRTYLYLYGVDSTKYIAFIDFGASFGQSGAYVIRNKDATEQVIN